MTLAHGSSPQCPWCVSASISCGVGHSSEICGVEHCGQDESESKSATSSAVPRVEADLLGRGAVVSRVFLVDSWVK